MQSGSQKERQTLFRICREVLEMYPNLDTEELDKRRAEMGKEYQGIGVINYESEVTHCAYIRTDVTCQAWALSYMIKYLHQIPIFQRLLSRQNNHDGSLTVASIGCGPGTDMIGVLNFFKDIPMDRQPLLRFALYDSIPGWQRAIGHFENVIRRNAVSDLENCFKTCFESSFYEWSLTQEPESCVWYPSLMLADLYIFASVWSDALRGSEADPKILQNAKANLVNIWQRAKPGAVFMFVDIQKNFDLSSVLQDTICAQPDAWHPIAWKDGFQLPTEEEKTDLGRFYSSTMQPKLGQHFQFQVFTKNVNAHAGQGAGQFGVGFGGAGVGGGGQMGPMGSGQGQHGAGGEAGFDIGFNANAGAGAGR